MADTVIDPFAGSYYMESLTDQVESEILEIMEKIEEMGGSVDAIKSGWMQREVAKSAYQFYRDVESGERVVVGVNRFTGDSELHVTTSRLVPTPMTPRNGRTPRKGTSQTLRRSKGSAITTECNRH